MNFSQYQGDARETAVFKHPMDETSQTIEEPITQNALLMVPVMYCALGLAGEAGEVAEQLKKAWRNDTEITEDRRSKIEDELGDVMWYVANLATELDLDLDVIARKNIAKLAKRAGEGKLKKR